MPDYKAAVEELKSRCSIIDVVGPLVSLKRTGANYKGCCPFHKEKTPSFIVSEDRGTYHCFGCGEHGDAIKFIEKYYNLTFTEAVDRLAAQYGITIEQGYYTDEKKRDAYYEANRLAAKYFFTKISKEANKGYGYVSRRGMDAQTIKAFGIGWATEDWGDLCDYLLKQGITKEMLIELGLASSKGEKIYDKFRSRVIFPIINTRGKVIGFGGRIVGEGEPKYLNSPESPVFKKKDNLYGLNKTRSFIQQEGYAILVEGYMDCVSLYQYGVCNVAASLGTALTENQAKLLSRYTKKVILCYDADQAGINAALRGIDVLRTAGLEVRVLHVDDGKDPDEFIKKHGKDAFIRLINEKSVPDVDYKISLLRNKYDIKDHTQGIKFLREAASVLKSLSPVETEVYTQKIASQYHISEGALRKEIDGSKSASASSAPSIKESKEHAIKIDAVDLKLEKMIIRLIILHADYYSDFRKYPEAFVTNEGFRLKEVFDKKYLRGVDFDIDGIKDALDEKEYEYLKDILQSVAAGNDKEAFKDCIKKLESKRMETRIKEIEDTLEMSDSLPEDEIDQDEIKKLMEEYKALQLKRKGEK